jgi:hypothetical protein
MDNHSNSNTLGLAHEQARGFPAALWFFRGLISRLISFFSVTEQDLKDAGVFRP